MLKNILKKYTYSDGDNIENFLLELFERNPSTQEIEDILANNPSWAIKYHLSKDRENLLNWFPFEKDSNILEIGAGCGAVTGALLREHTTVTSVELTKRRADIIRKRYKEYKNLQVLNGNIHKQTLKEKFDYATLIGVLEYAGRFTNDQHPFVKMLEETRRLIKKDGTLIIAIENRFGLKYWRGAPEDHTGKIFDSLEGYLEYEGVRTFGKEEIRELLVDSGFKSENIEFYYPIPDYKFCYELFSDKHLPSQFHNISNGMYPSPHPTANYSIFNEEAVANGIQKNLAFDFFANSFLIFARNE